MLSRREFLGRTVAGSSLLALGAASGITVPGFLARTARAAQPDQERILVVVEMTGGNDGLNTVVPYANDDYHKARPTLALKEKDIIRVQDGLGLHPELSGLEGLLLQDQLAIVQGVGYPNPNRSHFESMDIWQSADPRGRQKSGWLGRATADLKLQPGKMPAFHVGKEQLPLAFRGASTAVPTLHPDKDFGLNFDRDYEYELEDDELNIPLSTIGPIERELREEPEASAGPSREKLIRRLTELSAAGQPGGAADFTRRMSLDTYSTIERLREIMQGEFERPQGEFQFKNGQVNYLQEGLSYELQLVAQMIQADFGSRIYYVSQDGYDTHGDQAGDHRMLLQTLGTAISSFFFTLQNAGLADRVTLLTYSEFGRRVDENGSRGTDHGSGSCLFVAGPGVQGGVVGEHPSLKPGDLDDGDLRYHTDFRRVYASLLDDWLQVDSTRVLGEKFDPLPLIRRNHLRKAGHTITKGRE